MVARRLWNRQIMAFEREDHANIPPPGGIVFVGSSTFALWQSLGAQMHPLPVIRRGFGGSTIRDVIHYAPRIVLAYKPRIIVFYAGDNDIFLKHKFGFGAMASHDCLDDLKAFVALVHVDIPDALVDIVSIKPSPSRQAIWPLMAEANRLVKDYVARDPRLHFIDVASSMFDDNGQIHEKLYDIDRLHLNEGGYSVWASIIKPVISSQYKALAPVEANYKSLDPIGRS